MPGLFGLEDGITLKGAASAGVLLRVDAHLKPIASSARI